jgi:hypothetical protein
MAWQFPMGDDDPGTVTFAPSDPVSREVPRHAEMSPAIRDTLEAYRAGATTPKQLRDALTLGSLETAKSRLQRMHQYLAETGDDDA